MNLESRNPARLALEDGTVYEGWQYGARGTRCGETVFNTSMSGYTEILTDPSYKGQFVTFSYPQIGNYGVSDLDFESSSFQAEGVVIGQRNLSRSKRRSRRSTSKLTHNDKGRVFWHNGGMNRARASLQNALSTKIPSHHWRQRSSVRRSMPKLSRNNFTRSGFRPWIMAETSTTTKPA